MEYNVNINDLVGAERIYCLDIDKHNLDILYNDLLLGKTIKVMPFNLPFLWEHAVILRNNIIGGIIKIYRFSSTSHKIDYVIFENGVENYFNHYTVELSGQSAYRIDKFDDCDLWDIKGILVELLNREGIN